MESRGGRPEEDYAEISISPATNGLIGNTPLFGFNSDVRIYRHFRPDPITHRRRRLGVVQTSATMRSLTTTTTTALDQRTVAACDYNLFINVYTPQHSVYRACMLYDNIILYYGMHYATSLHHTHGPPDYGIEGKTINAEFINRCCVFEIFYNRVIIITI